MHLVFQVQTDDAVEIYVDQTIGRLKELLSKKKITVGSFTKRQLGRFTLGQFSPEDEGRSDRPSQELDAQEAPGIE